jgi:acetate kinase
MLLALNTGSSSIKARVYTEGPPGTLTEVAQASVDALLVEAPRWQVKWTPGQRASGTLVLPEQGDRVGTATTTLLAQLLTIAPPGASITAVAHRVVHGGARWQAPVRLTAQVLQEVDALRELAPLHNGPALDAIDAAHTTLPTAMHILCFDTAFHHTLPPVAYTYALPDQLRTGLGIRRFGFHGFSHEHCAQRLLYHLGVAATGTRLITCHLGNGSSLAAIRDGQSVDTSMGMTPLEGLVMGTRSGDLDPGIVLYLLSHGFRHDQLDHMLQHESGLLGLSGITSDMRSIEQAAQVGDAGAELACALFAYRVKKYIGAYTAALGGLDALAFTGGIGEYSAGMRARICSDLDVLGISLDDAANTAAGGEVCISSSSAKVQVWIVPANEEAGLAHAALALLGHI